MIAFFLGGLAVLLAGIGDAAAQAEPALVPEVVFVPAGPFVAGSDAAEREAAYRLDEAAYGHSVTRERGWYDGERTRGPQRTDAFWITRTPITNRQYAPFVASGGRAAPDVERETWESYGLIHPYDRTEPYRWPDGPPPGRADHPVVLVSIADARAYADWLSERTGQTWRLPTELEWEKAARGTDGRWFPWGNDFDPALLNTHDAGPFSTMPVGSFPDAASPYGALDMAGQVFEWVDTPGRPGRYLVKGGSWDDKGCGICRAAARHGRPEAIKHILIGFRLVREGPAAGRDR
jgi:formylglycine-generating enzyme required for sulfatase activity